MKSVSGRSDRSSMVKIIGGRLDLSNMNLKSLKFIGIQPAMEVLVVSGNQLESFHSLQPQPNLKTIVANNNPLRHLNGLEKQKSLENLELADTPIAQESNFRVRVLATVGPNLLQLQGVVLTRQDQELAKIFIKRSPEALFLADSIEEAEEVDPVKQESLKACETAYVMENQDNFVFFAENEARLFDLVQKGPLPYITEDSTPEEIMLAIENLKDRTKFLSQYTRDFCNDTR